MSLQLAPSPGIRGDVLGVPSFLESAHHGQTSAIRNCGEVASVDSVKHNQVKKAPPIYRQVRENIVHEIPRFNEYSRGPIQDRCTVAWRSKQTASLHPVCCKQPTKKLKHRCESVCAVLPLLWNHEGVAVRHRELMPMQPASARSGRT